MTLHKNDERLQRQEASLEPSKGFYRDSKSFLTDENIHAPKSMKIYEIRRPLRASSVGDSINQTIIPASLASPANSTVQWPSQLASQSSSQPTSQQAISWKSVKIRKILPNYKNRWNTMKIFRGQEASLESSWGFYECSRWLITDLLCFRTSMLRNPWKSFKILKIYGKL